MLCDMREGEPFYAMAAGTVVGAWRNAPENTPGSLHADYVAKKFAGGGNHVWILQDDGVYALYAHAQTGSIPAKLCPHEAALFSGTSGKGGSPMEDEVKVEAGAKVKAGQFLGRVGNSGASKDGPHLHVNMQKGDDPVAMAFDHGLTTPAVGGKAKPSGPWTKLEGKPLPGGEILIWPPRPTGNYTFKGTPGDEFQTLFDHMSDSGMMPTTIGCQNNGATYESNWVPSKGTWRCHHGMSAAKAEARHAEYTEKGYKRTSSFTCGSVSVAVWTKK